KAPEYTEILSLSLHDALPILADYFFKYKVAHPLSRIEIIADKSDFSIKDIKINQQSVDKNATYYVVTNDYLAKGGDRMDFFLKADRKSTRLNSSHVKISYAVC